MKYAGSVAEVLWELFPFWDKSIFRKGVLVVLKAFKMMDNRISVLLHDCVSLLKVKKGCRYVLLTIWIWRTVFRLLWGITDAPLQQREPACTTVQNKLQANIRSKMASAKRKGRGDDLKQEEILQAVVIADSFNVRFGPATSKKPRVCKVVC